MSRRRIRVSFEQVSELNGERRVRTEWNADPPTSKSDFQWDKTLKETGTLVSQTGSLPSFQALFIDNSTTFPPDTEKHLWLVSVRLANEHAESPGYHTPLRLVFL
ncbi:hypothetical protein TNCV_2197091 [Trichonephila clavipes]|nr:hypothetical protein TNCV_2197091 [Trichonephila clavipes]